MFIFLLISLTLLVSFTIPVHANNDPLKDLDDYIRKSMAEWQVPGLAVVVVKGDETVLMKGYGTRVVSEDLEIDENIGIGIFSNAYFYEYTAYDSLAFVNAVVLNAIDHYLGYDYVDWPNEMLEIVKKSK
jgi:hypothetical protein